MVNEMKLYKFYIGVFFTNVVIDKNIIEYVFFDDDYDDMKDKDFALSNFLEFRSFENEDKKRLNDIDYSKVYDIANDDSVEKPKIYLNGDNSIANLMKYFGHDYFIKIRTYSDYEAIKEIVNTEDHLIHISNSDDWFCDIGLRNISNQLETILMLLSIDYEKI